MFAVTNARKKRGTGQDKHIRGCLLKTLTRSTKKVRKKLEMSDGTNPLVTPS